MNNKGLLTEFDIYLYINAFDYLRECLNCNNITLTEGLENSITNKHKNILTDLFYNNIPAELIINYPISSIFKIKKDIYWI